MNNSMNSQAHLSMSVFARLRSAHLDDFARTILQQNEAVLLEGGALARLSLRSTGFSCVNFEISVIKL